MQKSRIYRLNPFDLDPDEETPLLPEERLRRPPAADEDDRDLPVELQRLVFDNRQRVNRR